MPVIVDTYNLLHLTGELGAEAAALDIPSLARLITRSRFAAEPIILVCDGTPPGGRRPITPPGVDVVYSGPDRCADLTIEHFIRRTSAPRRLTVVSSDRAIQAAARKRRAKVLDSETFLGRLLNDAARDDGAPRPARPPGSLPPDDVADWLSFFGEESIEALEKRVHEESRSRAGRRRGTRPGPLPTSPTPPTTKPAIPAEPNAPRPEHEPELDPELLKMIRESGAPIRPQDLDMSRWLDPDSGPPHPDHRKLPPF